MVDYKEGKIYRLVCNTTGQQYIGSTTQILSQRLGGHKAGYKRFVEGKSTMKVSSFNILCENNFKMILIEEYPCENKNQLERRERDFIETMVCVNKLKPAQTKEERKEQTQKYYQENKDEIQKYKQKHYQENKERKQKYYQENKEKNIALTKCECGGQYQHIGKSIHFKTLKHKNWLATHEII